MKNVSLDEFISNTKKYVTAVVTDDEFVTVETPQGNAVVISEAEWNILKQFADAMLNNPSKALEIISRK